MRRLPVISAKISGVDRSSFDEAYLEHLADLDSSLGDEVVRIVGHLTRVPRSGKTPAFDAATLVTLAEYTHTRHWAEANASRLDPGAGEVELHLGDEVEHWPYLRHWPLGEATPGIKQLVYSRRLPHLDPVEYQRRYLEHAVVTNYHHSGVWRYAQCYFSESLTDGGTEFDALAQLSFRSEREQKERMYLDDDSIPVVDVDIDRFLDRTSTAGVFAREYRIRG